MCTAYRAYLSRYRETSAPYAFTSPCNTRATSAASELSIPPGPCIDTYRHSRERVFALVRYACEGTVAIVTSLGNLRDGIAPRRIEPLLLARVPDQNGRRRKPPRKTLV